MGLLTRTVELVAVSKLAQKSPILVTFAVNMADMRIDDHNRKIESMPAVGEKFDVPVISKDFDIDVNHQMHPFIQRTMTQESHERQISKRQEKIARLSAARERLQPSVV